MQIEAGSQPAAEGMGSDIVELEVEREPSLRFLLSQVAEARSIKEAAGQVRHVLWICTYGSGQDTVAPTLCAALQLEC